MRTWLAACLLLLLAVPYHPYWQSFEQARRGLLLILVPALCLVPRVFPKAMPRAVLPFLAMVVWLLVRSFGIANPGLAWERTLMWLSLVALMIVASGMTPAQVIRSSLPTGLVVATVALAQNCAGLRPVSTLGNINVASEILTMTGAAAALLPAAGEQRRGWLAASSGTLFLCSAAVVANSSLSGLIALPLAVLPVLLAKKASGRVRAGVVGVLVAGMLAGSLIRYDEPAPAVVDPASPTEVVPSTTEVRVQLWQGVLAMGVDRFALGHGSGQFRVQYPRYRRPEEIEITTWGRQKPTGAESAHQDYLELFAEGGLLAVLLLAAGMLQVVRQAPVWTWGPLVGFGFLAGVRSPLGNAPAAALLFLWLGAVLHGLHERREPVSLQFPGRRFSLVLLGLCTMAVGASVFLGQMAFTGFVREYGNQQPGSRVARSSAARAAFWNGYEQRFLQAQAVLSVEDLERSSEEDAAARIATARARVLELLEAWPWDEEGLLLLGRTLHLAHQPAEAVTALARLRTIDPPNPRAALSQATILVEAGKAPEALAFLYKDMHPRLRAKLPRILADLHAVAQRRGLTQDADLLLVEQAFFDAVDALRKEPGFGSQLAVKNYLKEFQANPHDRADMRPLVIYALQFLALDRPEQARAVAEQARSRKLARAYRQLMGDVMKPLLALPEWQRILE